MTQQALPTNPKTKLNEEKKKKTKNKNLFSFPRLASVKVTELKDEEWHHVCAMWENTAGMASLFVDGAMRVRAQGKLVRGGRISLDGLFILGDGRNSDSDFSCILTCVRLWEGTMEEEEVKLAFDDKKCEDNDGVSVAWPWFELAQLEHEAQWSSSSSLLGEDLGINFCFCLK